MDGVDGSAPMSLGLTDEPRVHDLLTRPEALDRQALGVAERMDRFGGRAAERFVGFGAGASGEPPLVQALLERPLLGVQPLLAGGLLQRPWLDLADAPGDERWLEATEGYGFWDSETTQLLLPREAPFWADPASYIDQIDRSASPQAPDDALEHVAAVAPGQPPRRAAGAPRAPAPGAPAPELARPAASPAAATGARPAGSLVAPPAPAGPAEARRASSVRSTIGRWLASAATTPPSGAPTMADGPQAGPSGELPALPGAAASRRRSPSARAEAFASALGDRTDPLRLPGVATALALPPLTAFPLQSLHASAAPAEALGQPVWPGAGGPGGVLSTTRDPHPDAAGPASVRRGPMGPTARPASGTTRFRLGAELPQLPPLLDASSPAAGFGASEGEETAGHAPGLAGVGPAAAASATPSAARSRMARSTGRPGGPRYAGLPSLRLPRLDLSWFGGGAVPGGGSPGSPTPPLGTSSWSGAGPATDLAASHPPEARTPPAAPALGHLASPQAALPWERRMGLSDGSLLGAAGRPLPAGAAQTGLPPRPLATALLAEQLAGAVWHPSALAPGRPARVPEQDTLLALPGGSEAARPWSAAPAADETPPARPSLLAARWPGGDGVAAPGSIDLASPAGLGTSVRSTTDQLGSGGLSSNLQRLLHTLAARQQRAKLPGSLSGASGGAGGPASPGGSDDGGARGGHRGVDPSAWLRGLLGRPDTLERLEQHGGPWSGSAAARLGLPRGLADLLDAGAAGDTRQLPGFGRGFDAARTLALPAGERRGRPGGPAGFLPSELTRLAAASGTPGGPVAGSLRALDSPTLVKHLGKRHGLGRKLKARRLHGRRLARQRVELPGVAQWATSMAEAGAPGGIPRPGGLAGTHGFQLDVDLALMEAMDAWEAAFPGRIPFITPRGPGEGKEEPDFRGVDALPPTEAPLPPHRRDRAERDRKRDKVADLMKALQLEDDGAAAGYQVGRDIQGEPAPFDMSLIRPIMTVVAQRAQPMYSKSAPAAADGAGEQMHEQQIEIDPQKLEHVVDKLFEEIEHRMELEKQRRGW